MSRLRIIHTTAYRYSAPVSFGPHRLVIRPRAGHDLLIEHLELTTHPPARISWHRDLWGNSIAIARFDEKSDFLEFRAETTIRQSNLPPLIDLLEAFDVKFPVQYSPLEQPSINGYLTPVYPEEVEFLAQWMQETFPIAPDEDALQLVIRVNQWINQSIKYRRREDRGVQSPGETLKLRSGSCRDMATLFLEAIRTVQIASRFASGYLNSPSAAAGIAATHAWIEIYFPEHGWFGWDPTLGEQASKKHIVAGVSAHPRGVMPVSGTYSGVSGHYQGMNVTVQIEQLDAT